MTTYLGRVYSNGKVPAELLAPVDGGQLRLDAAASWKRLTAAMTRAGHPIAPTSYVDTYRPYEVQRRIFLQRYQTYPVTGIGPKGWDSDGNGVKETWWRKPVWAAAATPGTSNHGEGLAVDIERMGGFTSAKYKAMSRIAPAYGWDNNEGSQIAEAWHWVYKPANDQHRGATAPTPIEEDDMPLDKQDLENISEAVWWGGARSQVDRTVDGKAVKIPALQELADTNTRLLRLLERVDPDQLRKVIWIDTVVQREVNGQPARVPVLQELADAKSNAVDANIHAAKTRELVGKMPAGISVSVDTAALADALATRIVEQFGPNLAELLATNLAERLARKAP